MKKIFKINLILILGIIVSVVSCTKDFEDMNVNPNEPVDAPSTNILAHSLRYYADSFFDAWQNMNNFSSYSGQITKIQYVDEARYNYRESVVNAAWEDAYTTLLDLKKVQEKSDEEGTINMKAVAMTFSAYIWQIATDTWKAIPYANALQGEDGATNPTYSMQQDIYPDLLRMLKDAGDMFAQGNGDALGSGDILFNGDVMKWRKFCNSLRLRVAIRISKVDPATAQTHIEQIMGDQGTYPIMASNDDNALVFWPGAAPYKEPFYENSETRDDHGMCNVLLDKLVDLGDPRLPVYAHPAPSDGEYRGLDPGAEDGFSPSDISRIGARFRDNPSGFTPFMRYAEVLFIASEAAANGWNVGLTAQAAYEAGVTASLEENGIGADDIATYLANADVAWDGSMEKLYIQKWIALFKNGHEAWAEVRRTDVPVIDEAPGSPYGSHNRQPFRYPYPTDEINLNSANINQVTGGIVDHFWGQQMWWDTRSGVN